MRILIVLTAMAISSPLYAETYSWVDNKGIYNHTDDLSKVPLKYRNKTSSRRDNSDKKDNQAVALPTAKLPKAEKAATNQENKGIAAPLDSSGEKQLYGGKSHNEWQKEFVTQEAELKRIETELARIRQIIAAGRISQGQQILLLKEHSTLQADYSQKYIKYGQLVESAKKAGLLVEMKKQ